MIVTVRETPIPTSTAVVVAEIPGIPSAGDTVIRVGEELMFIPFESRRLYPTRYVPGLVGVQLRVAAFSVAHPVGSPHQ